MKMRRARKGIEHTHTGNQGEQVKCPICKVAWYADPPDRKILFGKCRHLRFYYLQGDFKFYGKWDKSRFKKLCTKAESAIIEEMGDFDTPRLFKKLHPDGVDEAIYVYYDPPMAEPLQVWGYKK